jgi:hypothetical protein
MIDHEETCAEGKIMEPFILQTGTEASNVFLLQAKDMDFEGEDSEEESFRSTLLIVYDHHIERWEEENTIDNKDEKKSVKKLTMVTETPIATEAVITDSILSPDEETIIVSTLGQGLITFKVNDLNANPEILQIGSFLKLAMSDCGRFAVAGGVNTVIVINPLNLQTLGRIPFIDNPCRDVVI